MEQKNSEMSKNDFEEKLKEIIDKKSELDKLIHDLQTMATRGFEGITTIHHFIYDDNVTLSVRLRNCIIDHFGREHIKHLLIEKLVSAYKNKSLLRMRNFGKSTQKELGLVLIQHNFLKNDTENKEIE